MNTSNYILRHILLQADIRSITEPEMKAATICYQNQAPVAEEIGANYHQSWTRLKALKERGEYTGRGRPPYILESEKT